MKTADGGTALRRFRRFLVRSVRLVLTLCLLTPVAAPARSDNQVPLVGYSSEAARGEREWEAKFRAVPSQAVLRETMQRLSARPHHIGTAQDRENAEWILARFKEWGWD